MSNNSSENNTSNNTVNANQVLEKFVLEVIKEQRSKRRWNIFFKLIFIFILLLLIWGLVGQGSIPSLFHENEKHIAEVNIYGEIAGDIGVDAADTIESLDSAAEDKNTQAIILDIDSPGGSPVQASYVYNEIRYLKSKHPKLPIYAVCQDVCASAAYYIASGADKIYANPTSLVGSIGVLMDGFGFTDAMKKVGVTRRLYTAGKYKGMLDPFSPENSQDVKFVQAMLDSDHQVFINDVKKGRGNRLKDDPNLFTGLIYDGTQAKEVGLIDDYGSLLDVARKVFDNDNIIDYTVQHNLLQQIVGQYGAEFAKQVRTELLTPHLG